ADVLKRAAAIGRVAGADVSRPGSRDRRVALFQVEVHRARAQASAGIRLEVSLRGADRRVVELRRDAAQPARTKCDVLIDLAHDRELCFANAKVERGGRPGTGAREDSQRPPRGEPAEDQRRLVAASVVDDDDLHWTAVALRDDGRKRVFDPRGAVPDRHDEADAFGHARPTISPYTASIRPQITSSPKRPRMRGCAAVAAALQPRVSSRTRLTAAASASASPSGTTWPPPTDATISPQPESSATTTGVPASSDSS